jgi:hypothetical protein
LSIDARKEEEEEEEEDIIHVLNEREIEDEITT